MLLWVQQVTIISMGELWYADYLIFGRMPSFIEMEQFACVYPSSTIAIIIELHRDNIEDLVAHALKVAKLSRCYPAYVRVRSRRLLFCDLPNSPPPFTIWLYWSHQYSRHHRVTILLLRDFHAFFSLARLCCCYTRLILSCRSITLRSFRAFLGCIGTAFRFVNVLFSAYAVLSSAYT